VKARVIGLKMLENSIKQRRQSRIARSRLNSWAAKLNPKDYGSIRELRLLLGLPQPYTSRSVHATSAVPEDALIVSFDTEWERHGLQDHVVEIGVTTLDTRDIIDTAPGEFAYDWISKAKTYHYVVDVTRRPTDRMRGCYFSDDMFADVETVRQDLLAILQQAAHPPNDSSKAIGHGSRKIVLAGHSVAADGNQLYRSPGLRIDLFSKEVFPTRPSMIFDTLMLTDAAIQRDAEARSAKLGRVVNWLGAHPQYKHNDSVIGTHNAGNDAAYTMMALLMYAVRWEQVVPSGNAPLFPKKLLAPRIRRGRKRKLSKDRAPKRRSIAPSRSEPIPQNKSAGSVYWPSWSQKMLGWLRRS
jgi:hypothetical protein